MDNASVLDVAVFTPLRRTYHYLPSAGVSVGPDLIGCRVRISFGRSQRIGVIVGVTDQVHQEIKLKPITELLDERSLIGESEMRLARWAADYYHHPIGEVLALCFAANLRRGEDAVMRQPMQWRLLTDNTFDFEKLRVRAPRQAAVVEHLAIAPRGDIDFAHFDFDWRRAMRELEKKNVVVLEPRAAQTTIPPNSASAHVALNDAQAAAASAILAHTSQFKTHLLHGVTGSGKTEVYIAVIEALLNRGATALMLVPEIILTQQIVIRLRARFGDAVAVLHSGLTDNERAQVWLRCRAGDIRILMGTRSAIWTQMPDLGVIIVDEEHDISFKQQDGLRYHARDVAIVRAQQRGIPIVLGTATPSLEACLNVRKNKFMRLALPQRAGSAVMPHIQCIDVRGQRLNGGLSEALVRAVEACMARQEQALLFLNRRGFAPVVLCHCCGWIASCTRCDAKMVWHKERQHLVCHHCDSRQRPERLEPCCPEPDLIPLGIGTEQVEEALRATFPEKTIARIDRDTMKRKTTMETTFAAIRDGSVDILIGTQMLAKGHDFSKVSLVGIVDADNQLFSTDFRAEERLAQMIVQVAGRAGRAKTSGHVLIQTHHPHHLLLQTLISRGYDNYTNEALAERKSAGLPPYAPMALIRAEGVKQIAPQRFLSALSQWVRNAKIRGLEVLGPVPSAMEKRAGRFRAQILLTAPQRGPLSLGIRASIAGAEHIPERRQVRWSIDVDPQDTL